MVQVLRSNMVCREKIWVREGTLNRALVPWVGDSLTRKTTVDTNEAE